MEIGKQVKLASPYVEGIILRNPKEKFVTKIPNGSVGVIERLGEKGVDYVSFEIRDDVVNIPSKWLLEV